MGVAYDLHDLALVQTGNAFIVVQSDPTTRDSVPTGYRFAVSFQNFKDQLKHNLLSIAGSLAPVCQ